MAVTSFPTWRIEPFSVHSRLRATAEDADALGNGDGKVTKGELEKMAQNYEKDGYSFAAKDARATWTRLESEGVSSVFASLPGAVARGIYNGLEALESKIFENVR